jgi:hypothetical protein
MPNGGQFSAGSGIRLQPTSPGVTDLGNLHISGNAIASNFSTSENLPGNLREVFGHGSASNADASVIVGSDNTISPNCINSVIIGTNSQVSAPGVTGQIAIGSSNNNSGNRSITFGSSVTCSAPNSILIGNSTNISSSGKCIAIGDGNTVGNGTFKEHLIIGAANSSGNFANFFCIGNNVNAPMDNFMSIGNGNHIAILLGPNDVSNGIGAGGNTQLVADANCTTDKPTCYVLYTSITGARTVQLTASNTFSKGSVIEIKDMSGNCSAVNTITVLRAGADLIEGAVSAVINTAYGKLKLITDGTSKWGKL